MTRNTGLIYPRFKIVFILLLVLIQQVSAEENVILIIIDGARYSETFGDDSRSLIPRMNEIATTGAIVDSFYNDGFTYTSRAIPAIWCGAWTEVRDTVYNGQSTQYTTLPTVFEYFQKQANPNQGQNYYVLKELTSLWLPSFHPDYGPAYWPDFHSVGATDEDVCTEALEVLQYYRPRFSLIYFADVDHGGHSGNWEEYTTQIREADSLVGVIWDMVQNDPHYAGNSTLLVTNDHGRHDDEHGGFTGHGCGCEGCRRIMLLTAGASVRSGYVSPENRTLRDVAVTACARLGVDAELATGTYMDDLFYSSDSPESFPIQPVTLALDHPFPNPFNPSTTLRFSILEDGYTSLSIYNMQGQLVDKVTAGWFQAGSYVFTWQPAELATGQYLIRLLQNEQTVNRKVILLR